MRATGTDGGSLTGDEDTGTFVAHFAQDFHQPGDQIRTFNIFVRFGKDDQLVKFLSVSPSPHPTHTARHGCALHAVQQNHL